MGWNWNMAIMPYGDTWRTHRRIGHQHLRYQAALDLRPVTLNKVRELLVNLRNQPIEFRDHIKTQVTIICIPRLNADCV